MKGSQQSSAISGGRLSGAYRCLYLMLSLLALLAVYPYVVGSPLRLTLLTLLNSATLIAGIYAVSGQRSHVTIAIAIGVPQLALAWWNVTRPDRQVELK